MRCWAHFMVDCFCIERGVLWCFICVRYTWILFFSSAYEPHVIGRCLSFTRSFSWFKAFWWGVAARFISVFAFGVCWGRGRWHHDRVYFPPCWTWGTPRSDRALLARYFLWNLWIEGVDFHYLPRPTMRVRSVIRKAWLLRRFRTRRVIWERCSTGKTTRYCSWWLWVWVLDILNLGFLSGLLSVWRKETNFWCRWVLGNLVNVLGDAIARWRFVFLVPCTIDCVWYYNIQNLH